MKFSQNPSKEIRMFQIPTSKRVQHLYIYYISERNTLVHLIMISNHIEFGIYLWYLVRTDKICV